MLTTPQVAAIRGRVKKIGSITLPCFVLAT